MSAPEWLKERMEALRKMPPQSREKLLAQWKAMAEYQREHTFNECRSFKGLMTTDSQGRQVMK